MNSMIRFTPMYTFPDGRMQKVILALILLLAAILPHVSGQAQSSASIDSLKIELWPEYDQPSMLVIYRFSLSPETSLPAQLNLRIPSSAGEPFVVAVGPSLEQVADVPYNRNIMGEWAEISFAATMPVIQFEYYDPGLRKQNSERSFEYSWPGEYGVQALSVEVQQPVDVTEMRISPSIGRGETRADGLVYYTSQVGSLNAGQSFSIKLEYQKPNDVLSVTRLQVQPSQPLTPDTTGRIRPESILPWALGLLGLVLIGGGGFWYWQAGRKQTGPGPKTKKKIRRRAVDRPVGIEDADVEQAGIYCHQCGKRAASSDRYCRSCGTRLRG
jgi:hypothetical protein